MEQIVECDGNGYVFTSVEKAIKYFMECYNACDPASSEAQRYSLILARLFQNAMSGNLKKVTDGVEV